MQMSNTLTRQERQAWEQIRSLIWMSIGLGILGALMFGPWGCFAGIVLGRALSKTDKIHFD